MAAVNKKKKVEVEAAQEGEIENRSIIWAFFDKCKEDKETWGICKVTSCKKKLKCNTGSTSVLFNHLRSIHPKVGKEADEKRNEAQNRKKQTEETHSQVAGKKQGKLDECFVNVAKFESSHPRQRQITDAIAVMMAADYQPYSMVDDRGFKHLLSVCEPRYHLPARTTFSRSIIPKLYATERQKCAKLLSDECDETLPSLAFTTDGWSSRSLDHYISFTVSYMTDDFVIRSIALENKPCSGSQTAECIIESLEQSMESWNLPTSVPIFAIRDNGSNLKAAIKRTIYHDIPCFAHTLQLAIGDAIDASDGMKAMLAKCRKIVGHYHHSCQATEKLENKMRKLNGHDESCVLSLVQYTMEQ